MLKITLIDDVVHCQFLESRVLEDSSVEKSGEELFRLVDELGRKNILLDFATVEFISSGILGKLIALYRKIQAVQGKLVIAALTKDIHEIFKVCKFDHIFTIVPSVSEAYEIFGIKKSD
jgi:anti-sigma B factor antagonist